MQLHVFYILKNTNEKHMHNYTSATEKHVIAEFNPSQLAVQFYCNVARGFTK